MLSIKERIEDYYDSLSANKLVFNNKKWNRRVQLPLKIVWILLYFPSLLIQYYKFNSLYMVTLSRMYDDSRFMWFFYIHKSSC